MTELSLFILLIAAGFYMSWNIGANDVANAMGTSVGSGALTLRQAIYIAAILEFSGAFFFGSHVSETMQSGIINPLYFVNDPKILFLGMLSSLIGTGIWLQIASYFGWPVSTTHAIVGSLVGFGAIVGGINSIYWENIFFIASSWIISPLLGGVFAYNLFGLIRQHIFFASQPLKAAKRLMPYLVFIVFFFLVLFLVLNGLDKFLNGISYLEAAIIGFIAALSAAMVAKRLVKQIPDTKDEENTKKEFETIEKCFAWLQVISACMMAFAHGANDVANAIGPLSAALYIFKTGSVSLNTSVPLWALALGGFGIVIGLATWGWRVIETIGKKITELTPTRGFAAEFGAAITILIASRLGMPISTTHTLVGAVIGVGLAGGIGALNLGMTKDIIASWVITLPAGALTAVLVYMILAAIYI